VKLYYRFVYFQAVLGTNPLSLAAPAKNGDSFVLDMATSACALGKVKTVHFVLHHAYNSIYLKY